MTTRLFIDQDLAPGATVGLDAPRAHYLRTVLRLKPGAVVALFNGRDGEFAARIDGIGKGWASLEVGACARPQDDPAERGPWLLFAPIKRARLDFLVQKATELGAAVLWPVWTKHTMVERVRTERLAANAIEAAEQCGRLSVPEVRETIELGRVVDGWAKAPETAGRAIYVCAERGDAVPMAELAARGPHDAALLTGPEGGFSASELDALCDLPFVTPIGLGPRLLRAETAALAALAGFQALCGDGKERPPDRG